MEFVGRMDNLDGESSSIYKWSIYSGGIFVVAAILLSMYLIFEHLGAYNQPEGRVPSWAALNGSCLQIDAAFNCEIIRDCYEAFALYCFERYLIACLGGEENTIELMESQGTFTSSIPLLDEAYAYGVVKHPFPLNCCLSAWQLGSDFYQAVKIGIVQYMILKMICALLAIVFEFLVPIVKLLISCCSRPRTICGLEIGKFLTFKCSWWQGVAVAFLFSLGAFQGHLAQVLKARIQDYIICIEIFPYIIFTVELNPTGVYLRLWLPFTKGSPPDPEEVRDSERTTRMRTARHDDLEKRLKFHQSVRDVVVGSGEIIVDDMKFTVSHVVEPVERGIAKINKTIHQISDNVKRFEERRKNSKDDSHIVPLNSWMREFSDVHEDLAEGSVSDSGLSDRRKAHNRSKGTSSRFKIR
ncbi:hypothetical protein Leryth_025508 [Lithospermum erythrorhizon]|nr:hypothetical protein Leryth_025508 [Lithospermum erythrorhizon]